jgi:phosphoserine phosphatase RsbU/P
MSAEFPDRFRKAALALLFLCAAASQVTYTVDLVALLGGHYPAKPAPFSEVLTVEGKPVRGLADWAEAVRSKAPGETLVFTTATGKHEARIAAETERPAVAYAIGAGLVMPVFCLLLGFWVTAVRLRDFRAWLMLGMLLGMSQLTRTSPIDPLGWTAFIGIPSSLLRSLGSVLWAVSMMFFGIYFPYRWSVDRKVPWAKWVLLAGPVVFAAELAAGLIAEALDSSLAARLPHGLLADNIAFLFLCPCISVFFAGIFQKYGEAKQTDDRRRLRLLYWGASVAMTPMFLTFVGSLLLHRRAPEGVLVGALLAMMVFPLTLAYIVVVQRAMDVRMVIRQGVQYALATRGARVLQALVVVGVVAVASTMAGTTGASRMQRFAYLTFGVLLALRIREFGDRLRRWIDRRFFREAYNADRILKELSEQVRGILDRDALLDTVARQIGQSLHVERVAVRLRGEGEGVPGEDDLVLPLVGRKERLGEIRLGPKKSEEPYSLTDKALLETVAAQTGLALENAQLSEAIAHEVAQRELLNREIEIAREVQQRLFPQSFPAVANLEYAGYCRPARGVGGDYYDFLGLPGGRFGLAIGDVSGKGVPAALLMASLQASVRGQSGSGNVAELMTTVNRLVCDVSPENRYATFFYGQYDPVSRRLIYSNGGHNSPMVLRGAEVLRLETGGPPVGLFPFSRYQQDEVQLEAGDLLIFFTDGISEAENPAQDEWGEEPLIVATRSVSGELPARIIERLMVEADRFANGAPQHDDMTLVIAKVG